MKINRNTVNCLLDSGSQLTTVPQSYYEQHLSSNEIKSLYDLLEVEGANGQTVPYLGYIEINVTFLKEFLGIEAYVSTLALVVPNIRTDPQSQVLIGTNPLDVLYELYNKACSEMRPPISNGYMAVLKVLELRHKQTKDGNLGLVTLYNRGPKLVPAGQTVVLEGFVSLTTSTAEKIVLLEHPSLSAIPGGVLVKPCLINLPERAPYIVPVALTNESEHVVTIPPKCLIGEINVFQRVLSQEHLIKSPESVGQQSNLTFNFESSPIDIGCKVRLTHKLNSKIVVKATPLVSRLLWVLQALY